MIKKIINFIKKKKKVLIIPLLSFFIMPLCSFNYSNNEEVKEVKEVINYKTFVQSYYNKFQFPSTNSSSDMLTTSFNFIINDNIFTSNYCIINFDSSFEIILSDIYPIGNDANNALLISLFSDRVNYIQTHAYINGNDVNIENYAFDYDSLINYLEINNTTFYDLLNDFINDNPNLLIDYKINSGDCSEQVNNALNGFINNTDMLKQFQFAYSNNNLMGLDIYIDLLAYNRDSSKKNTFIFENFKNIIKINDKTINLKQLIFTITTNGTLLEYSDCGYLAFMLRKSNLNRIHLVIQVLNNNEDYMGTLIDRDTEVIAPSQFENYLFPYVKVFTANSLSSQNQIDNAYQNGLNEGLAQGFNNGYNQGINEANTYHPFALFTKLGDFASNILSIELAPHLTIGGIILMPLIFGIVIFVMKLFKKS